MADPAGPPGGGSRRQAMVVAAFLPRQEILYQKKKNFDIKIRLEPIAICDKFISDSDSRTSGCPIKDFINSSVSN